METIKNDDTKAVNTTAAKSCCGPECCSETEVEKKEKLKATVRKKYTEIAKNNEESGCCDSGCGCGSDESTNILIENYVNLEGYIAEADLKLGCGIPTEFAEIKNGDTVVDLGSGAGNDVFVARTITGNEGKVLGIDMTEAMIQKARKNNSRLEFNNVEFRLGDIEKLPVEDNIADVVISNCVLNLVPDKKKAFSEIYRILKPGAHFTISDIVIKGDMPEKLKESAELYAGCVSGAVDQDEYLSIVNSAGFRDLEIKSSVSTPLPDELLQKYLSGEEIADYNKSVKGIFSITLKGTK